MRKAEIYLVATLLLASAYVRHPVAYGTTTGRFFLLSAVVDYHTFCIDLFSGGTVDTSLHGEHYYSAKAIGGPLLAIPVYYALRAIPATRGRQPVSPFHRYVICLVTTGAAFAFLGLVMRRMAQRWGADSWGSLRMVFAFSLGTIAWIHATMFSGHVMAGALCFFGFAMIQPLRSPHDATPDGEGTKTAGPEAEHEGLRNTPRGHALTVTFLAGLTTGLGALCDYTAMYLAGVLTIYLWTGGCSLRRKIAFVLGGAIPLGLLLGYNQACFGSPLAMSYGCLSYEAFAQGARRGFLGISLPSFSALGSLLVSPGRGLFFTMPILLVSISGIFRMRRVPGLRAEMWVIVAAFVGYLLINAGFYGWHGGWTFGPRYLVPMLPFLAMGMTFSKLHTRAFLTLLAVSTLQIVPAVLGMPHAPEAVRNPLPEVIVPLVSRGYTAVNWGNVFGLPGLWSWGPLIIGLPIGVWLTFRSADRPTQADGEAPPPGSAARAVPLLVLLWIAAGICSVRSTPGTADRAREVLLDHHRNFRLDACLRHLQESCPTVWQRREKE
ncbi:MAG: hypothetical protein HN742_39840 [Lentisphaerae bacterium]|jgi:hypothetical protein|nr:hypothetical protein [Lentisphaerota bacterium]MBT5611249.1 hypothetical protein [Lentisphaerota bacterium]MBT7057864.1 hypothetical protein [Lentisphaerota bacterium]MBT7848088.1 hypothetical protein [Lentisphaerota bacterium]